MRKIQSQVAYTAPVAKTAARGIAAAVGTSGLPLQVKWMRCKKVISSGIDRYFPYKEVKNFSKASLHYNYFTSFLKLSKISQQ